MWLDKKTDTNEEPPLKYQKLGYPQTFKELNPNAQYVFWNRSKVNQLFVDFPELQKYKNFFNNTIRRHIERCDFARYMLLWAYGGVYVDLDFVCTRNIYPMLKSRELLMFWEPREHLMAFFPPRLFNGFIGGIPKHYFWIELMDHIMRGYSKLKCVHDNTGPQCLARFAIKRKHYLKEHLFFGNRCWVLARTNHRRYCYECHHKPIKKPKKFNPNKRQKTVKEILWEMEFSDNNRYAYTNWKEGTGWFNGGTLSVKDKNQSTKSKLFFSDQEASEFYYLWIIFGIVLGAIVLGFIGMIISLAVKNRRLQKSVQ